MTNTTAKQEEAEKYDYAEAWLDFVRYKTAKCVFPREAQLWRHVVNNADEFLKVMTTNYRKMSCYTSLFSQAQLALGQVDVIFIDIDATSFEDAMQRGALMDNALKNRGLHYRKYFSGRRGFHYYIDIEPVVLMNPRQVIADFVYSLPNVFDQHCVGNIRQLVRVPYTMHQVTGLFACAAPGKFELSDAIAPKPIDVEVIINEQMSSMLTARDDIISERKVDVIPSVQNIETVSMPQCVLACIEELHETRELDHEKRLHMAAYLLMAGYSEQTIFNIFAIDANDFDPRLTSHQIRKMADANMKCYSCKRAIQLKLCPLTCALQKGCEFYPSINHRLPSQSN